MDNESALALIYVMLPTGSLRIITSEAADNVKDFAMLHLPALPMGEEEREEFLRQRREYYSVQEHRDEMMELAVATDNPKLRASILGVPHLPGTNLYDPRNYKVLKATRIDPHPQLPGHYAVSSDEWYFATIVGEPAALLRDLQKWQQVPPGSPATEPEEEPVEDML